MSPPASAARELGVAPARGSWPLKPCRSQRYLTRNPPAVVEVLPNATRTQSRQRRSSRRSHPAQSHRRYRILAAPARTHCGCPRLLYLATKTSLPRVWPQRHSVEPPLRHSGSSPGHENSPCPVHGDGFGNAIQVGCCVPHPSEVTRFVERENDGCAGDRVPEQCGRGAEVHSTGERPRDITIPRRSTATLAAVAEPSPVRLPGLLPQTSFPEPSYFARKISVLVSVPVGVLSIQPVRNIPRGVGGNPRARVRWPAPERRAQSVNPSGCIWRSRRNPPHIAWPTARCQGRSGPLRVECDVTVALAVNRDSDPGTLLAGSGAPIGTKTAVPRRIWKAATSRPASIPTVIAVEAVGNAFGSLRISWNDCLKPQLAVLGCCVVPMNRRTAARS